MQQRLLLSSTSASSSKLHGTQLAAGARWAAACAAIAILLALAGMQVMRLHGHWNLVVGTQAEAAAAHPSVEPARLQYPVWWHAPFYTGTGYGTEAISYISSLLQTERFRREDIWLSHSGDHIVQHVESSLDEATRQLLQDQEYNSLAKGRLPKAELDRPAIAVCHSFPDCWLMPQDIPGMMVPGCPCPPPEVNDLIVYRVGRTMFETAGLPEHLVQHCNAMDEVWVPTEFNRETFISAGVIPDKLRVVPQGIDAADFDPNKHQPLTLRDLPDARMLTGTAHNASLAPQPFVFMSVFKWEARKGWDVLLEAYLTEFLGADPVELHIMTKPFANKDQDIGDQVLAWVQKRLGVHNTQVADLPRIYLHTSYLDDATYRRLYASTDCVVLPTRGEGWGRPQMEAMSMAKPLITTNWSGPAAYINSDVAYPLAYNITAASIDMQSTQTDDKSVNEYFQHEQWAQPNVQHLRLLMRRVYANPLEAAATGRAARQHILQHFTPDVLASLVLAEIVRIQEKLGPDRTVPTAEERAARQQSHSLCLMYPHLCRQGPAGMAEAARRAQVSFTHYRATDGPARTLMPGHLTVQELLARARESGAAAGVNLGFS